MPRRENKVQKMKICETNFVFARWHRLDVVVNDVEKIKTI